jgi:hypothetical protein
MDETAIAVIVADPHGLAAAHLRQAGEEGRDQPARPARFGSRVQVDCGSASRYRLAGGPPEGSGIQAEARQ